MQWENLDTWIALTAALVAMSCAVPGTFLVLRRQSMLGDALSHTALPGIVAAFLFAHWMRVNGWFSGEEMGSTFHAILLVGAVAAGVLTAFLTETVQRFGRVENSAALGVVYTSLFALGLLLIRLYADNVHLDADCVLFGTVETVVLDCVGDSDVPKALVLNAFVFALNLMLVLLAFKELRLTTFDPAMASSIGVNASLVHYLLMAVTAVTLVAAFQSVGSILVITVLIAPAVTAWLLTDRMHLMLILAICIAGTSAFLGHLMAITFPTLVFQPLGFETVRDTNTAGMTALACGLLFLLALLFSPRKGVVSHVVRQTMLGFRIGCEDLLGSLYRTEESGSAKPQPPVEVWSRALRPIMDRIVLWRLIRRGLIRPATVGCQLTETGRVEAERLVRSHRLWESYMARHFELPPDHLHEAAHRVEHYLDDPLLDQIDDELQQPGEDPHGRSIPRSKRPSDGA
jgi:manganese/zinc/iron transport system permease protein